MFDWNMYLWCAIGVIISVILPPLSQYIKGEFSIAERGGKEIWIILKPYVGLIVLSLIISLLIIAFMGDIIPDWKGALLAGYASDSTLQKIRG